MGTVERFERAVLEARRRGFEVRFEALQGTAGGLCEFGAKRWIFVDLTAQVGEQLEQILTALKLAEARSRTISQSHVA